MAYGQKYQITYATKADKDVVVKIWQDTYTGSLISLQGIDVNLQYIPQSDDPFEPIFASEMGISVDFTDNTSDMIDFTNINDRYLYVEMFVNGIVEWVGYIINDNVSISYSTGRKIVSFNATDGLGMLKDIRFPISEFPYWLGCNETQSLTFILWACFKALGFPTTRNFITMCSYFAAGMDTRAAYSYADPFRQTYLPYRTFIDSDGNFTYCLEIISNIARSFGCRVFQAKGKWWIVAINEFASANAYYTEYNTVASSVNNGDGNIINTSSTIQPFNGNTSNLYFINNSQVKLLKKGFNKVISEGNVEIAPNYIANANLKDLTGGVANFWTLDVASTSSVTVIQDAESVYNAFELVNGSSPSSYARIQSQYMPNVRTGDSSKFSMKILTGITSSVIGLIDITLTGVAYVGGPTVTYYLKSDYTWQTTSISYIVYNPTAGTVATSFDLTISPAIFPIDGQLSFKYRLESGAVSSLFISNFNLQIKSTIQKYKYEGYVLNNNQYLKNISIPYGFYAGDTGSALNPSQLGVLLLADGTAAYLWRRYGIDTVNYFGTLQQLLIQQYINVFGKNIINVDCNLSSFYTSNTNYPLLDGSKLFFATDDDPASINISGNSYMLGNCTITYPTDQTQATLLYISNTDITCTKETKYFYQTTNF
jgi:hypothetical protein